MHSLFMKPDSRTYRISSRIIALILEHLTAKFTPWTDSKVAAFLILNECSLRIARHSQQEIWRSEVPHSRREDVLVTLWLKLKLKDAFFILTRQISSLSLPPPPLSIQWKRINIVPIKMDRERDDPPTQPQLIICSLN